MTCREAQSHIFSERDGALDITQRAGLDGHLRQCGDCRRIRENLSAALTAWRIEVRKVPVPDAEREWHAVRRRIRGGAEAGAERAARPRRNLFTWVGVPLGAAAAIALALFVSQRPPSVDPVTPVPAHVARANTVDITGENATVIMVDDKSGWMFVWASDATPKRG